MLERLQADARSATLEDSYRKWIPILIKKYRFLVPAIFEDGPFHLLAPVKEISAWFLGLWRPVMRGPFGKAEQELWAVKTAALACENFMLALTAAGFDSCAMEGFDEHRVKKLLALPRAARVVMVIAAGQRGPEALIPQIRFERSSYYSKA